MSTINPDILTTLQQQAEAGNGLAQFEVACLHVKEQDLLWGLDKKAFTWLEKSANQGNSNAQLAMAFYYLFKTDRELMMRKWRNHLNNAACNKPLDLAVTLVLSVLFEANDDQLGIQWLKKAPAKNNAEAQFWLGYCYNQGIGVEQNDQAAFDCFKKAADQNVSDAMYWLAYCYFEGTGTVKDEDIAFDWLMKSVESGCDDGFLLLGDCYHQGKRVDQSFELACKWYEKAANLNNALAQHKLAEHFLIGKGVEKNFDTAFEWEEKAAENGNVEAKEILIRLFLGSGMGFRTGEHNGQKFDINPELAFENFNRAAAYGSPEAYYLLGECYENAIGIEKNDKLAFEHYERVLKYENTAYLSDLIKTGTHIAIARCYREGIGTEKNEQLAQQHDDLVDKKIMGDCVIEGLLYSSPKSEFAKEILLLRLNLYNATGEYDQARDYLNGVEGMDKDHREACRALINAKEEVAQKNDELTEKNKKLIEAEKDLEDLMAMFAHKFRSPLDAIIYNTTHGNQEKLYSEAAQTMRGLLDIFSIISTDESVLKTKLKQDKLGNSNLLVVFGKTLDAIMLHLLSVSGTEKIQQHYFAFAKAHNKCDAQLSYKSWSEDYFELEHQLQADWEQSYAQLLTQSARLKQRLDWLEQHFFKLELHGLENNNIQFKEYGVTESFLTILLNEVLVNAFKYYSSADNQPVVLQWVEKDGYQVLNCANPSVRRERQVIKGSGKGHTFLSALARKTGSQFSKPKRQDDFVLEFGIDNELLMVKPGNK